MWSDRKIRPSPLYVSLSAFPLSCRRCISWRLCQISRRSFSKMPDFEEISRQIVCFRTKTLHYFPEMLNETKPSRSKQTINNVFSTSTSLSDERRYDPIQGQGHEHFKVGNPAIFKSYLLRHLQWELATDHDSETRAQYLNLIWPDF